MSIELVMPSSHLILSRPLLLLPPIPPSIRVFSNESALHKRWPKYWSFSFSIILSKEQPGLISFSMDWLDLLAVQGTLKSLLQHHNSKTSILQKVYEIQIIHKESKRKSSNKNYSLHLLGGYFVSAFCFPRLNSCSGWRNILDVSVQPRVLCLLDIF